MASQDASTTSDKLLLRGDATRARELDAAANLFATRGYSATSIAKIGDAAGVHAASIYHAFGSKEGLLAAVVERSSEEFFADLGQPLGAADLIARIEALAETFIDGPEFLRLMLVLALERREGDPAIIEAAAAVRAHARQMISRALEVDLGHLPVERRERAFDDLGRLALMLLDGAMVARQIEGPEALPHTFELIVAAIRGLLTHLTEEAV
jgi:AcrR family transcriptional regulator